MVETKPRKEKAQGLSVKPDQLSNQLDLFDSRLNAVKAKYWNRVCLKHLHYGKNQSS